MPMAHGCPSFLGIWLDPLTYLVKVPFLVAGDQLSDKFCRLCLGNILCIFEDYCWNEIIQNCWQGLVWAQQSDADVQCQQ